ncbi:MAG: RHS repeat-associated core domain-containing protein, partial [Chloroflexi bacterium]|nr:RHS repeat-associated core domain-containing protein [Chloroflexota bacterium]
DAAARLTDLTVSGASGSPTPFSFSYDADDMLTQAGDLTLNYDAQTGLINDTTLDNTTDSWSFNPFTELNSYSAAYNSADVFAVQYGRDDLGRITQKVETVSGQTVTTTYSYDAAGRLETETVNGNNIATYTYDSNGNRLSDGTNNAAYDDQDRLLQYGSASYSYTANGELLTKTVGGQTTAYTYDVLGNLVGVTLPNSDQITYLIDGDNRRIGKLVNGTLVQGFLYQDGLNPVAELDGNGDIVSLFIYASQSNVPDYMIKNGIKYRIISDHLGSPRLIINSQTGVVAQEMHYTGFGQVTQNTTPNFQPFGFAGGLYDTDTSLVRFGARDYDAENGRWTTKDPIKFASYSTNHYTYLGSEPINHTDLSGLICGTGACVAVGIGAVRATQIGWRIYNAYKAGQAAASIANSLPNISPSDDASSGTQGSEEPGSCSADNTEDSESGDEGGTRGGSQPNIGAGRPKWEDILRNGPKKIGPSTPGKGGSRGR